jgi:hypothetical protein
LVLASTFDVVGVVEPFFLSSPSSSRSLVDMVSQSRTLNPL